MADAPIAAPVAAAPTPVTAPKPVAPKPSNGATGKETPAAVEPAPPPVQTEEEELLELKVGDKTERLTRAQVIARAQKAEAADRRFREASEKQKRAEELIAEFEADPEAAYARTGKDPAKLFETYLAKKARDATLTPEQKEREALQKQLEEYKAREAKTVAEQKTKAQEEQDKRTFANLESKLLGAASKHGLDQTPETLEMLCDVALEAIDMGYSLTEDQICQEVIHRQKQHISARDQKILTKYLNDPAKLAEYIGPKAVEALLKHSLTKAPPPGGAPAAPKARPAKDPATGRYMSEAEFERSVGMRK